MLVPENVVSKVVKTSFIYYSFNFDFASNIWTGILPRSVPRNLFVGIAENQAIWLATVQMKEFATPVVRQDIVLETARLLHSLLVTWSFAITASSKATLQLTAPMTRRAKIVGRLVTWHVIVKMILCAIYVIYPVIWLEIAPSLVLLKRGVVDSVLWVEVEDIGTLYAEPASK